MRGPRGPHRFDLVNRAHQAPAQIRKGWSILPEIFMLFDHVQRATKDFNKSTGQNSFIPSDLARARSGRLMLGSFG